MERKEEKPEVAILKKKIKKQSRTIIVLTVYVVLSIFIQLYNMLF